MTNQILWIVFALLAGALASTQAGINGELGKTLQNPLAATIVSFVVALCALVLVALVTRTELPTAESIGNAPWWSWFGGLLGAAFIFLMVFLIPKIGVGAATALAVAAQIVTALIIDHFGLLRLPVQPLNIYRLAGVALMIGGVILIKRF